MKKSLIILMWFFGSVLSFGQTVGKSSVTTQADSIYTSVEVKPEFVGGMKAFYNYVGANFKIPNVKGLSGKVFAQFVVEKDGSLSSVRVLRDIGHGTGKEALRVLSNSPKWTPGLQNGVPVRVLYSLPINITTPSKSN